MPPFTHPLSHLLQKQTLTLTHTPFHTHSHTFSYILKQSFTYPLTYPPFHTPSFTSSHSSSILEHFHSLTYIHTPFHNSLTHTHTHTSTPPFTPSHLLTPLSLSLPFTPSPSLSHPHPPLTRCGNRHHLCQVPPTQPQSHEHNLRPDRRSRHLRAATPPHESREIPRGGRYGSTCLASLRSVHSLLHPFHQSYPAICGCDGASIAGFVDTRS